MTHFLADENFNTDIVQGIRRRIPSLNIIRIQELGMAGWEDPAILEWVASNDRVVLTHDVGDMTKYAYDRIRAQVPMPGVVEVPDRLPVGRAIDDLVYLIGCSLDHEWENQVRFLPIR